MYNSEYDNKVINNLINSVSDYIAIYNSEGFIVNVNKNIEKFSGLKHHQLIGKSVFEVVQNDSYVVKTIKTGMGFKNKELYIDMFNKNYHVELTLVPILNEEGSVDAVLSIFRNLVEIRQVLDKIVGTHSTFFFNDIIYKSKIMERTVQLAKQASEGPLPVLLQGESGTGKELFAHSIHNYSKRSNEPFVIVDCAAIPRNLVESELFGYTEGAFTGASKNGRIGKFEMANKGTVFLDEIGEMPLETQAKLLRVIQSKCIVRVGGTKSIPVDVRIIAATNRDLAEEVILKNFREDLYYRLNVIPIHIPSLRERPEDIEVLIDYFFNNYRIKLKKSEVYMTEEIKKILLEHNWPGNIRELENIVARIINLSSGETLFDVLPEYIKSSNGQIINKPTKEFVNYKEIEKQNLLSSLDFNNWNITKTSKDLDISRTTLYKRIKEFNIIKT